MTTTKTKLEQFTKRKSPLTGKPYPRCQKTTRDGQCDKAVYAESLCYKHLSESEHLEQFTERKEST